MDKKRIAIIGIFLLVVIGVGYLLYNVFFAKEKPPVTAYPPGEIWPPGEFPPSIEGELLRPGELPVGVLPPSEARPGETYRPSEEVVEREKRIVQSEIASPTIDSRGNAQFYNKNDGKFYRMDSDGTVRVLSDEVFYNVEKVTWSPKSDESIIEYPDGANIYYNFQTKKQVTLPTHWQNFSFAAAGDKIASKSIALSPENRWLITSDPDGGDVKFIESLGDNYNKVTVDWSPNRKIAALSRTGAPLGADRQEVLLIGLHGENFKSLTVEGRGMQSEWSPSGSQLLYSVYSARSDYKPELWIVNSDGANIDTNRRPINVNTWAEKCAFANERFVYCGVPAELETGWGFEPSLADGTPDQIFRIDLQTGSKSIINTDGAHIIEQMFVSDDGNKLHFTDKLEDGLFAIDL
jgi:Tol biopolymer transport system component